jgi:hypothetical protein
MPSGGLRPAIVLAVIALVGLGAWTAYYTVPLSLSCNVSESISRLFSRDYRRRAGDIRQRLRVVFRMPFEPVGTVKPRRFIAPHPLMIPGFVDKLSAARWLFGFRIAISLEGPALRAHRRNAPYSLPDWLLPRNQTDRVTLPRKGKLPCGEFPRCIFLAEGGDVSLQPKMSIEVGVHHSHTTPSYGDGFIVSRSNRGALGMILILTFARTFQHALALRRRTDTVQTRLARTYPRIRVIVENQEISVRVRMHGGGRSPDRTCSATNSLVTGK